MEVEIKELEGYKKSLSIEVPREEVDKKLSEAYKKISGEAFVPGFRKGKVPLKILKLYYGREIKKQVGGELIEEYYKRAIQENNVKVVAAPEIKDGEVEEGKPLKFEAVVEAIPHLKIGQYKGIKVEKEKIEVTDEDVEAVLQQKREEEAELIPVKDRPSQKGDLLTVDYQVEIDNKIVRELKDQRLILGRTSIPPEWEEALTGVKKGEGKEIKIKAQRKEGKEATYRFTIKDIRERRLLILTDDFARRLGNFDNLSELKRKIKSELEELARLKEEEELKNKILEKILENSEIDIPPSMVNRLSSYYKVSVQVISEEESHRLAEKEIKKQLIIDEIAEREKLEVTDEELKKRKAETFGEKKADKDLEEDLRREKVMNFLISNANIKSKEKRVILTPEDVREVSSRKSWWQRGRRIISPGG